MDDRPTEATVHLGAIRANYAEACRRAGTRSVIAVVKADAYGHGAGPVARALVDAGCPRLAVATVAEGLELRSAGIAVPILVLGGVGDGAPYALRARLTPVVHHRGHVERLRKLASPEVPLAVHVEVDTGMRRMGAPPDEAVGVLAAVAAEPALALEGVFTHFARADEPDPGPTLEQAALFRDVLARARERGAAAARLVHCANSAALCLGRVLDAALPEANAVRPGVLLYGVPPTPRLAPALRPAMTLRTRIAHLRAVRPGEAVGYSALWRASRATRIATLPIGYADGVPISASGRGAALIRGRRHLFSGRVSMDFVTVDVGDAPVEIGDEAILFGAAEQGALPVEEAAAAAGTIAYELLVRVGARVRRVYAE